MYVLLIFLSAIGSCFAGLFGRHLGFLGSIFITTNCLFFSFIFSLFVFYEVALRNCFVYVKLGTWVNSEILQVSWGFMFDSLTVCMCVVITFVSLSVHLYSSEYLQHDPHLPRFMAYLSLFTFFMLILISADNLLQMFVGWEGVGLCSYLLINFWFTRIQANKAAIKAMVLNRVGDFSLLISIFLIFIYYKSIDYSIIAVLTPFFQNSKLYFLNTELNVLNVISLFIFVGCIAKSAQLGLHGWLSDAMEGPTPVSALIHAATMVTAGIFLITRCSLVYEYSTAMLEVIAIIGATTSFFASTIGLLQNDLKRVIAYSTCAQLGYMMFACGLSNYAIGFFHLANHAFLCAVLVHIFSPGVTAFTVLERPAYVVVKYFCQVVVEYNWTVKVYISGFIWGWLAKSDSVTAIRVESTYSVKEKCLLKLLESQRLTTQELSWFHITLNFYICRRRPYFCCFKDLLSFRKLYKTSVYNNRINYYNEGVFYNYRCDNLNNKQIKFSGRRHFCDNLRSLKNEIQILSKGVYSKILKSMDFDNNFLKGNCEFILKLIRLQQKLLSLYAIRYGMHDVKTTGLANNYLCSLVFRIHAVSKLLKNTWFKIPGMDGVVLKCAEYCEWVKYLSYSNVFKHKVGLIKRVYISNFKEGKRPLSIPIIADRLTQMLFVITYEPIVETVSDTYSFGFRKNRNVHQALGVLFTRLHKLSGKNQSFYAPSYVLSYGVGKVFDSVDHNQLVREFPVHSKHGLLLKVWLKAYTQFEEIVSLNYADFFQGNVVGPLLANFALNGLEDVINPDQIRYQNEIKRESLIKKGLSKDKANKQCRVVILNVVIRCAGDLIIVTNCKNDVLKIALKVGEFLSVRGFKTNTTQSKVFKINSGLTFSFLGFMFKFIKRPKITRLTKKVNDFGQVIKAKTGLFVYVSDDSVRRFKSKINCELKFLSRSPFQMILKLNPIIRNWVNYFGIGSYEIFGKIDGYIFKRCFQFIQKKFAKMSKRKIAANFFLYKIGNINWNFNAPNKKPNRNTLVHHVCLVRICSMIKFISIPTFCPYDKELKNPFVYSEIKGQWSNRISKLRYKIGTSLNIMTLLYNKQKGVCPVCSESLGYLNNSNFKIHYVRQQSLFSDLKKADMNKQLWHINCDQFIPIEKK